MKHLLFFIFGVLPHLITLGLAGYRFRNWTGIELYLGIALFVIWVAWIFLESSFITVQDSGQGKAEQDKGTFEFYFLSKWATVWTAIILVDTTMFSYPLIAVWFGMFVVGVAFRLYSIKVLGNFYSHHVRIKDEHKIVDTGPYRVLRHPSYSGMYIAHIGFVLFFFNWISLGLLVVLFLPAIITRILVEEKALMQVPAYKKFAATRKRLVPFIW